MSGNIVGERPDSPGGGRQPSTYAPLRRAIFRRLWLASLASNVGTWVQGVGAAWLMTELSGSGLMIALVQAATTLPVFVLALPAGALADIVDRRRLLLVAQAWMLAAAMALAVVAYLGLVTPWLLLAFTFALGLGFALNAPAWQAVTPELVPRLEVPAAVTLNSVSLNLARAVGPALGGVVVAAAGVAGAFLLNALSFLGVLAVLGLWRRQGRASALPAERLVGAMRVGVRYVRHAPEFRAVLVRGAAFVVGGSGLWALLPVAVKEDAARGPEAYGVLLGCLGTGAVLGLVLLPALQRLFGPDRLVALGSVVFAAATLTLAWVPSYPLWCVALVLAGAAWLVALTRLNSAAQVAVPSWVRARALSVYLLAFYGGMAAGSVLWGAAADFLGVRWSLTMSAAWAVVGLAAAWRYRLPSSLGDGLEPSGHWPEMAAMPGVEPDRGPVLVTVEYCIGPGEAGDFLKALASLKEVRLRDGAVRWDVFQDAADLGRIVEVFLVESWVEHLRQHERVTEADRSIQEKVRAFHKGVGQPRVTHLIAGLDRVALEAGKQPEGVPAAEVS